MLIAVDVLLVLGLLWLSWQVVSREHLFRSLIMFVIFGLLMAVVWARLGSPDLALAEAAVGAGVMGAMLMLTYRRLEHMQPTQPRCEPQERGSLVAVAVAVLSGLLMLAVGLTLFDAPSTPAAAGEGSLRESAQSSIGNPVTAVLLLFRGYDTLLEILVLLVAWVGAASVGSAPTSGQQPTPGPTPLLNALLAVVVPGSVLVGGYLMHAGGQAPGGAFQAGAVLAAAGVLLALCGRLRPQSYPPLKQRVALVLGPLVFTVLALSGLMTDHPLMALPSGWAVYVVEAALTVSIATCLLLLFLGARGVRRSPR